MSQGHDPHAAEYASGFRDVGFQVLQFQLVPTWPTRSLFSTTGRAYIHPCNLAVIKYLITSCAAFLVVAVKGFPQTNMGSIAHAFPRHARHQLPAPILVKASLNRPSPTLSQSGQPSIAAQSEQPPIAAISRRGRTQTSTTFAKVAWSDITVLGTITQGSVQFLIVNQCEDRSRLLMLAKASSAEHNNKRVMRHPNILSVEIILQDKDAFYAGYAYTRTTLEDMLNVHIPFGEKEIKVVAVSLFAAVTELYQQGFAHGAINSRNVRVCGRTLRLKLLVPCHPNGNTSASLTDDLDALGLLLLRCMEVPAKRRTYTAAEIRRFRVDNKLFGLSNSERWSGCKQLVDFIEDLFSEDRPALVKVQKPHKYVCAATPSTELVTPYVELAVLECFTAFQAAIPGGDNLPIEDQ